jgi:hypothetical protein
MNAWHLALQIEREQAPRLDNQIFRLNEEEKKKRRSEISGRDLQKPFGEFKTVNSLQDDKY